MDDANFYARFLRMYPKGRCSLNVFPLNFQGAMEVGVAPPEPQALSSLACRLCTYSTPRPQDILFCENAEASLKDSLYFRPIKGGLRFVKSAAQPLSSGRSYTDNDKETIRRMNADL
eukprot:4030568-Prymnesium_polylepis.1